MAILQEILAWTQGLPAWQSDAVSRLLAKQTLTPQDYEDLYALLKLAHGIPDPKNRQPQPLTADQIPAQVEANTHIELRAIKNLRNVNAIAEGQQLAVGPAGMTVIYGDNGSGKSGYSRVLKRACRARDQSEPIHPMPICQKPRLAMLKRPSTLRSTVLSRKWLGTKGKKRHQSFLHSPSSTRIAHAPIWIARMTSPTCRMVLKYSRRSPKSANNSKPPLRRSKSSRPWTSPHSPRCTEKQPSES